LNECGARRITLYPVQDQSCTKVPHTNGSRARGSKEDGTYLHTGIFSAMVFGGHTSTLDRYVDTVSYQDSCGCSLIILSSERCLLAAHQLRDIAIG
jgi:hypothetical protein